MNESKITVAKGVRIAMVLFALLLSLVALQVFGARTAEAGPIGAAGDGTSFPCPIPLMQSPTPVSWTGTDANEKKCGSQWDDTLNGAGGDDELYGTQRNDKLYGGTGNDRLVGDNCDDTISCDFPDTLAPGIGADKTYAGGGNDTIVVSSDGQVDYIDGGHGTDTLRVTSCGSLESIDTVINVELQSRIAC